MQQPAEIEVVFCDLCGASVPASDLATQKAVPFSGKVVGACCLGPLRAAGGGAARPAGREPRALPLFGVALAAIAAAAFYLDGKVGDVRTIAADNQHLLEERLGANGEALQNLTMAMDGAARREHVDDLTERLAVLERALMAAHEQGREALEPLRAGVAALQQQAQRQQAVAIDYRPLFDELRQQLQRQALAIADLRAAGGAVAANPSPAVPPPAGEPVAAPAAPGLSPALQAQIAKLASAEAALRFEAVDELARSKEPAVLPSLLPMVRDADAFVRRLTVEVLRDFRHVDSVDALLAALADDDENVRDTAWRSLRELTGQKLAFDATASKDARGKAVAKWQEWWGSARSTFGS